jgi:hypothetical protein
LSRSRAQLDFKPLIRMHVAVRRERNGRVGDSRRFSEASEELMVEMKAIAVVYAFMTPAFREGLGELEKK